jgi:hypothetical protein
MNSNSFFKLINILIATFVATVVFSSLFVSLLNFLFDGLGTNLVKYIFVFSCIFFLFLSYKHFNTSPLKQRKFSERELSLLAILGTIRVFCIIIFLGVVFGFFSLVISSYFFSEVVASYVAIAVFLFTIIFCWVNSTINKTIKQIFG